MCASMEEDFISVVWISASSVIVMWNDFYDLWSMLFQKQEQNIDNFNADMTIYNRKKQEK